jgi:uncharacterized protein with von Willebrand factor type A (vWA) domain
MQTHSTENEERTEEENKEENTSICTPEVLDKHISELIDRVNSLQKEIADLSEPIQQLLKDIRVSIYEIENPFSYASQVAHKRLEETKPKETSSEEEEGKPDRLEKEREPSESDLLKAINLMQKLSKFWDTKDRQKILDLLIETDFVSPEMKDLLKEVIKKL